MNIWENKGTMVLPINFIVAFAEDILLDSLQNIQEDMLYRNIPITKVSQI